MVVTCSTSGAEKDPGMLDMWIRTNSPSSDKTSVFSMDADVSSANSLQVDESPSIVAIIGVGYVGEHLMTVFSSCYQVIGYDVSEARIEDLKKRHSAKQESITFTSQEVDLKEATHFLISVPTLLLPDRSIDLSHVRSALDTVTRHARPSSTVVIESSIAVGMTRELLGSLALSHDLFVGMSPERVDPGRVNPPPRSIPKIVSGLDDLMPGSLGQIARLYSRVFDTVIKVTKPEVAEMTKLYENCQRMIAIAYANEMADACIPLEIDPFEVAAAAATKPFGYLPVTPSAGVGGHCIPINPLYLLSNYDFPLLKAATDMMSQRPAQVAHRLMQSLREERVVFTEPYNFRPRVLIVGMGFKPGQSHVTNSPGLSLASVLAESGKVDVMFVDPLVSQAAVPGIPRLDERYWVCRVLDAFDGIVVATRQPGLDLDLLAQLRHPHIQNWCKPIC